MDRCQPSTNRSKRAVERWRRSPARRAMAWLFALVALAGLFSTAGAQEVANRPAQIDAPDSLSTMPEEWTTPERLTSTIQIMLLLTVLSLAPAVLIMTTSFVRIVIVLGLLRQAMGTQQMPPSQVITSAALFLSLLIMAPVWKQVYDNGIRPYSEREMTLDEAWVEGVAPIRRFMSLQIERTGNSDNIWLFVDYLPDDAAPESYDEVPLQVLLPAFFDERAKDRVLDRIPNLPAFPDPRHGDRQRDDLNGHADAAARTDLVAIQTATVRPGGRLASGHWDAVGEFRVVWVTAGGEFRCAAGKCVAG